MTEIKERFPETSPTLLTDVYLHFHTTVKGCANVFVKCCRKDAKLFIKNIPFLDQFVTIKSLDGGEVTLPLTSIDIKICKKIIPHKDCTHYCPLCLQKNKKWCQQELNQHIHTSNPILIQKGDLLYYKETDLFESIILYTLDNLVDLFKKNQMIINIKDEHINQITLKIDGKKSYSIKLPYLRIQQCSQFTWVEPDNANNIEWIRVINDLIKLCNLTESESLTPMKIIFSPCHN